MKKIFRSTIIFGFAVFVLTSCGQPDNEYIQEQFSRIHKTSKFISANETSVSYPCWYWSVKYQDSLNKIQEESWQLYDQKVDYGKYKIVITPN